MPTTLRCIQRTSGIADKIRSRRMYPGVETRTFRPKLKRLTCQVIERMTKLFIQKTELNKMRYTKH